MKQRLIEQVGRSSRLRVLNELKRAPAGLPVRELASRLGMSYMGVKDLCVDLEKRGLLDTWRNPGGTGRPQKLYRLTRRTHELFPVASDSFTLEVLTAAQKLFGAAGAEKLLMIAFQNWAVSYGARMRGETILERAESLARLRDADGYMCAFTVREDGCAQLSEHHSPLLDVAKKYPILAKLEVDLFEKLLGTKVVRVEAATSGAYCVTYRLENISCGGT